MKKILFTLAIASSLLTANAQVSKQSVQQQAAQVEQALTDQSVIKHTVTLRDGRVATAYYKKVGDFYEIYTKDNPRDYQEQDIASLLQSNFEKVDKVEGKLLRKIKVSEAPALLSKLLKLI